MNTWGTNILTMLKANVFPVLIGLTAVVWACYTNRAAVMSVIAKLKKQFGFGKPTRPATNPTALTILPEINEIALVADPRHLVFYYLERIRKHAEETHNTEAVEHCIMLLNDLFKVYPDNITDPTADQVELKKGKTK